MISNISTILAFGFAVVAIICGAALSAIILDIIFKDLDK